MTEFERYINRIRNIARDNIQNGTPEKAIEEIRSLRIRYSLPKNVEKQALEILRDETRILGYEFVKELYAPVQKSAEQSIKGLVKSIPKRVIDVIQKGKNGELSKEDVLQKLRTANNVEAQYLNTVYDTVSKSLSRSQTFLDAEKAEIQRFKYAGRTGGNIRKFCADHVGKIYTLQEMQELDNGQGLPVQFFCGGYNCTHRWLPVIE